MPMARVCGPLLLVISSLALGQTQSRPLNQSEIAALLAGGALPENVVFAIQQRGVNFKLQPADEQMLRNLGDSSQVISAIKAAKVNSGEGVAAIAGVNATLIKVKGLIKERKYDDAAQQLSAEISAHPQANELAFVMGQILLLQQRGAPAVALYQELLERDRNFPEAHTKLGGAYTLMNDYDEAIAEERMALDGNPRNAQAHKTVASVLEKKGKHEAAIAEFQQAVKFKPDYAGAYFGLAIAYRSEHDLEHSLSMFRKTVALEPENPDFHFYFAGTLRDDARQKNLVAGVQERMQAVEEYRVVKRLAPERLDVRDALGNLLLNMQRVGEAEKEFRDLTKIAPDLALAHYGLGRVLLRQEKALSEAEGEFSRAIRLDPTEPGFHCGLGEVYYKQQRFKEAIPQFEQGQEAGCEEGAYWLGKIFLDQQHDAAKAVIQFRGAVQMASDDWRAHHELGRALEATGNEVNAISEYREALTLFPESPDGNKNLARLLEKQSDYAAALEQYTRMIHLHLATYSDLAAARERAQKHVADLKAVGKQSQAMELAARLAAFEHSSDENPETGLVAAKESASKAFRERRYSDAENEWKKALEYAERIQPRDGRLTGTLYEYGNFLQAQQRFAEAEGVFRRGISVAEEGSAYELRWQPLYQAMASLCDRRHDIACAEDFYLRDLHMVERLFPDQPFLAGELVAVGGFYFNNQLFDKAEPLFQRALALSAAERPGISSAQTASQLGDIYKARKDYAHAEGYYRQSIKLYQQIEDPGRGNIVHPMDGLIAVLHATGREDEAGDVAKQRQAATPPRPQPVSSK